MSFFRVFSTVPRRHVDAVRASHGQDGQRALLADVERRLEGLGFHDAIAMQDPTDPALFSAIARWSERVTDAPDAILRVLCTEPVEDPPRTRTDAVPASMDDGLQPEELVALRHALVLEDNPRHLHGFAATMEPALPIAASLLHAKAALLDDRTVMARRNAESRVRAVSEKPTGYNPTRATGLLPNRTAVMLRKASAGLGPRVDQMWTALAPKAPRWLPETPASALRSTPAELETKRKDLGTYQRARKLPIDLVQDHVRQVACRVVDHEHEEVAPGPVEAAGRAIVREVSPGVAIVDAAALRRVCPPTGREGYVSPSALQLALATSKPRSSKIRNPEEAARICRELAKAGPNEIEAIRAKVELFRARRAIERQRWIEWYRRVRERYAERPPRRL